ncbi:MAG: hypothetical protein OEY49_07930 [Candidatus Heimdallarchaeota archaeon]|nr:hypothetical protein [Candidatus Heimdallarchaeota archaeon]
MLEKLWILSKDGRVFYTKSCPLSETNENLIGGFLGAIHMFIQETISSEIKSINMTNKKLSFQVDEDIIVVLQTDYLDNTILITKLLKTITFQFKSMFQEILKKKVVKVSQFNKFDTYFSNFTFPIELSLSCASCNDLIIFDFTTKEHNGEKFHFCCESCKKLYLPLDLNENQNLINLTN